MNSVLLGLLVGLCLSAGLPTTAQETVHIVEPARVSIEDLLKQADLAALVRIVSGDTEEYPSAVYKAEVIRPFKGTTVGTTIFFGPFITYALGGEYVVFLRHSEKGVEPKVHLSAPGISYGPIQTLYVVMYDGYGSMPVEYVCAFDGQEISQQCDYGIKLNTYQVIFPKHLKTFPTQFVGASSEDTRWVRKTALISFLEKLAK